MTQNIENPLSYLPNHLVQLSCWISYKDDIDPRAKLLDLAHDAPSEKIRRSARVVLAKMDWAEMNLEEGDFAIQTFKTPLREMTRDPHWYDSMGAGPQDFLHQVCISFEHELDYQLYRAGVDEIY